MLIRPPGGEYDNLSVRNVQVVGSSPISSTPEALVAGDVLAAPWLHPLVRPQRDRATLASCLGRRLTLSVSRPLAGTRHYGWVLSRRHRGAGSRGLIRLTRWWRAP